MLMVLKLMSRMQYGTTKYCSAFLHNKLCNNRNCVFLHNTGEDSNNDSCQDISSMNAIGRDSREQGISSLISQSQATDKIYASRARKGPPQTSEVPLKWPYGIIGGQSSSQPLPLEPLRMRGTHGEQKHEVSGRITTKNGRRAPSLCFWNHTSIRTR